MATLPTGMGLLASALTYQACGVDPLAVLCALSQPPDILSPLHKISTNCVILFPFIIDAYIFIVFKLEIHYCCH